MNLLSRREALLRSGTGFGSLALADLMINESNAEVGKIDPLAPKQAHYPQKQNM